MQQSLRPYVTAGIAIVGASPIAVSPAPATVAGGDLSANLTNVLVELLPRLF
ncbi:hypothetical protein [Mycobacterium sp.]|jgi:hypothetical protein|uniref:hypothetical protein n=1 Tax=Mycobacterium sp. TaxID=1785 RepID=UPI002C3C01DE|nr:hypothetical protein [Mycobacterium sp.]HXB86670.1 hypothetical protein [Mycobacterium sp.]